MARLVLALLMFAMAMAVLKAGIVAIVLAGLVFRTGPTLAILLLLGLLELVSRDPPLGLAVLAAVVAAALWAKKINDQPPT